MVSERRAGAVLSYVSLGINAITSFIYVPVLIGSLSQSEYGVYQLIGSIISYLSVMDMGLSTTLNRFYVMSEAQGGGRRTENLLAMAAVVYGVITALALFACALLNSALDSLLSASFTEVELALAHRMMLLVAVNCLVVLPGNWFLALINANERFVFARMLSCLKYLLQCVCTIVVMSWTPGAEIALMVQIVLNLAVVVGYVVYGKLRLRVKVHFHTWDWKLAGSLFSFSFFVLLNMIFDQIFWKTGQFVLGAVVGAGATAVYGVACQFITSGYMQVASGVSGVFLPRLTSLAARSEDMSEINSIFIKVGRIQAILVWGLLAAFTVLGQEFVWLWAGADYGDVYWIDLILMVGLSISLIQNVGISVLQAKNMQGFRSAVYIVIALLDLIVSIPISAGYGVVGCAMTAAIFLLLGTGPVINWYYWRRVGIDIPRFYRSVLPLLGPITLAAVITGVLTILIPGGFSWTHLAMLCVCFCSVYGIALWRFGLNAYEKSLLGGVMRKLGEVVSNG